MLCLKEGQRGAGDEREIKECRLLRGEKMKGSELGEGSLGEQERDDGRRAEERRGERDDRHL